MAVTAWRYAGAGTSETYDGSGSWTNPGNVTASDNARAQQTVGLGGVSRPLRSRSFGFTSADVPAGATIVGVEVGVERSSSSASKLTDYNVQLVAAGSGAAARVGVGKFSGGYWPTVDAEVIYGGAADLWSSSLTQADVTSSDFGVDVQCENSVSGLPVANVDAVRIRIHYTAPATGYTLDAAGTSFTLTGQDVTLKASRKLGLGAASYALAGQDVALRAQRRLPVSAGAYTLSGQAVGLKASRALSAGAGAFALTGQTVGLVYVPTGGGYTLAAGVGSFAVSGQAVTLKASRRLAAEAGAFALTGQDVTLGYSPAGGYVLSLGAGSFALTGFPVADYVSPSDWQTRSPTAETWSKPGQTGEIWVSPAPDTPGPPGFGPLGDAPGANIWTVRGS